MPAEPTTPGRATAAILRLRRGLARRLDPTPPAPAVPVQKAQLEALELAERRLEHDRATLAERKQLRRAFAALERRKRRVDRERMSAEERIRARDRRRSLTDFAKEHRTDKWGVHFYTPHYERYLGHLRDESFTLLEIGIGGYAHELTGGASLRMWEQFFPHATIVGLDIEDKEFVRTERIHPVLGSQTDEAVLGEIVRTHGAPLVVVDDGSHVPADIIATFGLLFPLLPDGAIYIIEDTQTSYWPENGGREELDAPDTTMAFAKQLLDGLNYEEFTLEGYEPTYTDLNIVALHAHHNLVIVEKGRNQEGTNKFRALAKRYAGRTD